MSNVTTVNFGRTDNSNVHVDPASYINEVLSPMFVKATAIAQDTFRAAMVAAGFGADGKIDERRTQAFVRWAKKHEGILA